MKLFKNLFKKKKVKDDRFGKFVKELRKERNLSQYELADMIPISREAVSKWERNTTMPNQDSLKRLSEIFEISTDELLIGKRLSDLEKEELAKLTIDLYKQKNKSKKMLVISIIIIFALLFAFFAYYFISSYNSIKVYRLKYDNDNITIKDGIFVTTRKKFYFNVSNIQTDKEVIGLRLYYKNKNKEEVEISSFNKDNMFLYDLYGYDKYFKYKDLKYVLNNMYLDIEYEDETETIKLNFYKDFANSLFSKDEKPSVSEENKLYYIKEEFSEELIMRKFILEDGFYYYILDDNIKFTYDDISRILNLNVKNGKTIKEWSYNFNSNNLEYHEYVDFKEINYFNYNDSCNDECLEQMNYFYDLISEILS